MRTWLRKREALLTDADAVAVIRRLAAIGAAGSSGPNVLRLTDDQLIELRDGFARVPDHERETLGRDVGHAIRLQGHRYDRAGKREDIDVAPAGRTYLPDWTVRNARRASPSPPVARPGWCGCGPGTPRSCSAAAPGWAPVSS